MDGDVFEDDDDVVVFRYEGGEKPLTYNYRKSNWEGKPSFEKKIFF